MRDDVVPEILPHALAPEVTSHYEHSDVSMESAQFDPNA